VEPMEGIFDNFIANLLKEALDLSKVDKAKLKSAVVSACDAMKPATKLPADFDDKAWDMLADLLHKQIDKLGVQDAGPITVGAGREYVESSREFSAAEVEGFLASCNCDESRKARVRGSKRIMKTLYATDKATGADVFTDDERRKVVGAFPWLMLIQLFGPLIIDLIKRWLSGN
jgi:hypothetical protein